MPQTLELNPLINNYDINVVIIGDLPVDTIQRNDTNIETNSPGGPGYFIAKALSALMSDNVTFNIQIIAGIGDDYPKTKLPRNIKLYSWSTDIKKSMSYINIYTNDGKRKQKMYPGDSGDFPVITNNLLEHLGITLPDQGLLFITPLRPIFIQSTDIISSYFQSYTKIAEIQAWMRSFDDEGNVFRRKIDEIDVDIIEMCRHRNFDFIVFSREDIENADEFADRWSRVTNELDKTDQNKTVVIVTKDYEGVSIYINGERLDIPAFKIDRITDPTGAGDQWTAYFAIMFNITKKLEFSAKFANTATALALQNGINNLKLYQILNLI